jgi:hypothetical protein
LGPQVYKHLFGGILFVVPTTKIATTAARVRAHAVLKASRSAVRDPLTTSLDRRVEGARRAARMTAIRSSSLGAPVPKTQ